MHCILNAIHYEMADYFINKSYIKLSYRDRGLSLTTMDTEDVGSDVHSHL